MDSSKLCVVWTSADKDVAIKMVYMYTFNAKKNGWWDEVCLIVWGPSAKLLAGDEELQGRIAAMKEPSMPVAGAEMASILSASNAAISAGTKTKM